MIGASKYFQSGFIMIENSTLKRRMTLISKGYVQEDIYELADKTVQFRKRIRPQEGVLAYDIVIKYDVFLSDHYRGSLEDNSTYFFEGVRLVVWRRDDVDSYDDDADSDYKPLLRKIGSQEIHPTTLRMLEQFAAVLGYSPPPATETDSETEA